MPHTVAAQDYEDDDQSTSDELDVRNERRSVIKNIVLKDLLIVAVTSIFSIMATVTITFLTEERQITELDVKRIVRESTTTMLPREQIIELLNDKVPYAKDKDDIYQSIQGLEQQTSRIEAKMDILLTWAVPGTPHSTSPSFRSTAPPYSPSTKKP